MPTTAEERLLAEVHRWPIEELFERFATSHQGLSAAEVGLRAAQFGPNRISERRPPPLVVTFGRHLVNRFALLLWVGALLSFLGESFQPGEGMGTIGWALVAVVIVNAIFTFWQEAKAEHAMAAFRRMLSPRARVVRSGQELEVDASDLVPGDVIILREGDGVPADARLFELHALKVNNASLTGESEPQLRSLESTSQLRLDSRNLVFSGTLVSAGSGRAVVYSTGDDTELGRIALATLATRSVQSPMHREIHYFINVISAIAVLLGVVFFSIGWLLGNPFWGNLIFAIGIIVANVPEGLLPTVTLALSLAAVRMSRRRALVKTLESVETLGRTTVICTDKTGTLTCNDMRVQGVYVGMAHYRIEGGRLRYAPEVRALPGPDGPTGAPIDRLISSIVLCNNASLSLHQGHLRVLGDPTEGALLLLAEELAPEVGVTSLRQRWRRVLELPFSSQTRSMTTVHRKDGECVATLKGAPEVVLERCSSILIDGPRPWALHPDTRQRILQQNELYAQQGKRVLAVSFRLVPPDRDPETEAKGDGFTFLGLVAMYDPPRPEVTQAVATCRRAGVRVVVVSGDHPMTVDSVAREVGIVTGQSRVLLSGAELVALSDGELSERLAADEVVLARTSPQDKLRVVQLLQARGQVVAVTGDGVNDAPALKKADIGVAMGLTGTDVAKEAADMVLTDDNFSTIVAAVEEGRVIYGNIRKFIAYVLTSNVPEILPYIAFVLVGIPLPLTVVLILAVDLGTDLLPALALAAEEPEDDVMDQPPLDPGQRLLSSRLLFLSYGVYGVIQAAAGFASYFAVLAWGGWIWGQSLAYSDPLYRQAIGAFFISIVVTQVTDLLICRTRRQSVFTKGLWSNPVALAGIAAELGLAAVIVYSPWGHAVFNTAALPHWVWLVSVPFALLILVLDEVRKLLRRRGNAFVERWLTW